MFDEVYKILEEIKSEPKTTEKSKIIKKYSSNKLFHLVVLYAYDFNRMFYVTKVEYKPEFKKEENVQNVRNIFKYLDYLSSKTGASDSEKDELSKISSISLITVDIVNRIITKDLKCGASLKTFAKVFKDIPTFEIMTCTSDLDVFIRRYQRKKETSLFWSRKKDGVRTLATVNQNGEISYTSRSGLKYNNFSRFDDDMIKLTSILSSNYGLPSSIPIDGEAISEKGDYNSTMKFIRVKNNEVDDNYIFNIFDIAYPNMELRERQRILKEVFSKNTFETFVLLDHVEIKTTNPNKDELLDIMDKVVKEGEEGIVIKMGSSPYEFKEKSGYWCKMKPCETLDLLVVDKFYGKEGTKYEDCLGGLIVKFKNNTVRVGIGFSDSERTDFLVDTPRIIEVGYKCITPDGLLREPRFIRRRDDKFTVTDDDTE